MQAVHGVSLHHDTKHRAGQGQGQGRPGQAQKLRADAQTAAKGRFVQVRVKVLGLRCRCRIDSVSGNCTVAGSSVVIYYSSTTITAVKVQPKASVGLVHIQSSHSFPAWRALDQNASTIKTTLRAFATRTRCLHHRIRQSCSTFPAQGLREANTRRRHLRHGLPGSSRSTSRQMRSSECPSTLSVCLECLKETSEVGPNAHDSRILPWQWSTKCARSD